MAPQWLHLWRYPAHTLLLFFFALFFLLLSHSLAQWDEPPSSGTAFKRAGTASTLTKDIQYCDSLWLSAKSWKNGCGIDKRNLSGNNRFIFLICLKGVLYCRYGEGERTHKHTQPWFQHSITVFFPLYWHSTWHAL